MKDENVLHAISEMVDGQTADIKVALEPNNFFPLKKDADKLGDLVIVNTSQSPLYGWKSICKRALDISTSLLMLIAFSPLLLLIVLIIKCTSRGPIFYRQKRISLNETSFELIKFRTMVENAEDPSGPAWTSNADKRRTWIGKILRRYSLDEFPQFLNVLNGEMSVVGPRPERQVFAERFSRRIPKYMLRHTMKPGMTGWAQIYGWRGDTSIDKRVEYDLYYIKNWSLWMDVKIIFLTIPAIIKGGGAY
jgi:exopolysaccharide biosynthesis polyprenyl glycosylphosphotransferase